MNTPDPKKHWQNRRRMAWIALAGAMLYPMLVLFTDNESIAGIAPHYYLFAGAVVGAYIGFATWGDKP
jgi:hypothetical protein